jgi:hypothetical protein
MEPQQFGPTVDRLLMAAEVLALLDLDGLITRSQQLRGIAALGDLAVTGPSVAWLTATAELAVAARAFLDVRNELADPLTAMMHDRRIAFARGAEAIDAIRRVCRHEIVMEVPARLAGGRWLPNNQPRRPHCRICGENGAAVLAEQGAAQAQHDAVGPQAAGDQL